MVQSENSGFSYSGPFIGSPDGPDPARLHWAQQSPPTAETTCF